MSLRNQAIKGVKWTSVAAIIGALIQIIQIAVLTRFLDKEDFGLMAIALFVIGISQIFIDMGISNAIVHKQKVNHFQLNTLFWLNIIMGAILFIIVTGLSPYIARFYHNVKLIRIINLIALTFLIIPWGQQIEALLKKDLMFKELSVRDIIGKTIGCIVAVGLAFLKFGVYALVYSNLIASIISTVLLLIFGLNRHRPKLIFSIRSLRGKGFFKFGIYQMGEKMLNYFSGNFDTLIIGRVLGMNALGLYNIAKTLSLKPYQILNPIITKVAFPLFAKVQDEILILKRAYLKIVNLLSSLNSLIYISIIVLAKPLIIFIFGNSWIEATPILQLLSIGALCNGIGNPVGSLQLARGRADWGFYWNLGIVLLMPFIIWCGSFYNIIGVAFALAVFKVFIVVFPSWYFFIKPLCKAKFKEYSLSYMIPILLAIISGLVGYFIIYQINNLLIKFLLGSFIILLIYLFLCYKFNKDFFRELKEFGLNIKIRN